MEPAGWRPWRIICASTSAALCCTPEHWTLCCDPLHTQEKENAAMEKLAVLMPQMGAAVKVLALKEAGFSLEAALNLLRAFQTQNDESLKTIQKVREGGTGCEIGASCNRK